MRAIAIGMMVCAGMASAQVNYSVPAEFPPDSYTGRQYVDSRGCAYVRAGVEGAVNWLPRVTRERKPMCGLEPTFAKGTTPAAPSVAAASVPAATTVAATTGATPQPKPATSIRTAQAPTRLPPGYVRVWDDDRLNSRRAEGTPQGEAAMARIWTDDVPAKLVPVETLNAVPTTYVQVATFGSEAERTQVIESLRQQGVPARYGFIRRGTQETLAALVGPYGTKAEAEAVLRSVKALGYSEARLR